MSITLIRCVTRKGRLSRSKDPHLPMYPAMVRVSNVHNHNLFVADALKHWDVGAKATETLSRLFEIGHSPLLALDVLKSDLQMEHGENYIFASANRALCPDLKFCYRLYQKVFRKEYGEQSGPS
ncbi:hypothetical protein J4Q44_G00203090 [Coregonus suidteri]|uniref:Uncharacterized protein n=1 Tax=Coregonus suidteri TaxID=861788 RepID=A0AAN8LRJ5_9TELE